MLVHYLVNLQETLFELKKSLFRDTMLIALAKKMEV